MRARRFRALRTAVALVSLGASALLSTPSLLAADTGWQAPAALAPKLDALSAEQRSFLESGAFLQFMPARQLELTLETRDAAALSTMVNSLMAVAAEMSYDASRDMGAIPLNLNSQDFNRGVIPPPELRKKKRDPGPFGVHRYLFPESGVPTFAGAPVAIYPEDLVAGAVDVALIGVPNDMSSGRRDAGSGPKAMRSLDTIAIPDIQTLVDPMEVLNVVDYGDFAVDNMSTERTVGHVAQMVAETAATGAIPMMVGGDTSMLYPAVKGLAATHGNTSFGLVHFSAHPDVDGDATHTISDTKALFLLIDENIIKGSDLITVGLRGEAVTPASLGWLREQGVRYHTMAEVNQRGYDSVLKRVQNELKKLPDRIFVSIDVSALKPSDMVAAGRIVSGGLEIQQVTSTIRYLCAARDIVGFELTDMAPMQDHSRLSAVHANSVLNACLVGIAARKAGYKPDDVNPLALDHGQR
jgi:arginase family enzyme